MSLKSEWQVECLDGAIDRVPLELRPVKFKHLWTNI